MTGAYLPFCYPNWAAKFYLDGLLALGGRQSGAAATRAGAERPSLAGRPAAKSPGRDPESLS
jgi:hypothetical protein